VHQRVSLEASLTQALLTQVHQPYQSHINELLLSALLLTLHEWSGQRQVLIGLEGHGREALPGCESAQGLDTSRTVGWFTNLYPVVLALPETSGQGISPQGQTSQEGQASQEGLGELIKGVKEQLRQVPDKGMGYGALRYLHPQEQVRHSLALPLLPVVFNYLGQLDQLVGQDGLLAGASESIGASISGANRALASLEINGQVMAGQLTLTWSYSAEAYSARTMSRLSERYLWQLSRLIEHCQQVQQPQFTPSDFGLQGKVSLQQLDAFLQKEDSAEKVDILEF
jgi:non-ribosomal peptide synthase protein (TIGR01720 family)